MIGQNMWDRLRRREGATMMNVRRNIHGEECDENGNPLPAAMRDRFTSRLAVIYLGLALLSIVVGPMLLEAMYAMRGVPASDQPQVSREAVLILASTIAASLGLILHGNRTAANDSEAAALRANLAQSEARHSAEVAALRDRLRDVGQVPPVMSPLPSPAPVVPVPVVVPGPVIAPVVPVAPDPVVVITPPPVAPHAPVPAPVVVNVNGRDLIDDEAV